MSIYPSPTNSHYTSQYIPNTSPLKITAPHTIVYSTCYVYNGHMTENNIRRAERRAKAIDLLGGCCTRCGTIEKLEFDHIANDRIDKKHTLAWLLHGKWDLVLEELAKCQLLCRNCHATKTQQEDLGNGSVVHGRLSGYMHFKCRCQDCRDVFAKYYRDRRRRLHAASNSLY